MQKQFKVKEVLEKKKIDLQKVKGLGSDGASVVCGKHNGVGVRLQMDCPYLIHVHCAAHRVALVASNAARDTQKVADCRRVLNNVHFYFKNSAQRYERLRELHPAFEESDFISLKEPCSVCWWASPRLWRVSSPTGKCWWWCWIRMAGATPLLKASYISWRPTGL